MTRLLPMLGLIALGAAHAAGLNDTGQTQCYDSGGAVIACNTAPAADDGRYGRDAAAAAGALTKIGGGAAGFDFTKIANNGGLLAASVAIGPNPADWACTRDNVTGLIWEVKASTAGDLRYSGHTYTWYSTDSATNGGNPGFNANSTTCGGTLPSCNIQDYVAAVNAATLCGYTDWRLPSLRELLTLASSGGSPSIDPTYFPNTLGGNYWSATSYALDPTQAWYASFSDNSGNIVSKQLSTYVQLVRGGSF